MTEIPEKNEMTQLLESVKAQEKAAKKALWHQRIRTALTLVLVLAVLTIVPPAKQTLKTVEEMSVQVATLTQEAGKAVEQLMTTVEELDLENTIAGIDALVEDSSKVVETSAEDIQKSLEMLAGLDVEGLNKSIQALETVTRSIGRLFGYNG